MNPTLKTARKTKYTRNRSNHRSIQPNEYSRKHYMAKSPSAPALKIMILFISHAAENMAEDIEHTITWEDIKLYLKDLKLTQTSIKSYFQELTSTNIIYEGDDAWGSSAILSKAYCYQNTRTSNQIQIKFQFGQGFREAAKNSNGYTMLDIPYMMKFKKKYSITLYELLASYINLKHTSAKTYDFEYLRKLLGIPTKSSYTNYEVVSKCLLPALEEIDKIPYIDIHIHLTKKGQKYTHVTFHFDTHYKRKNIKKNHMGDPIGVTRIE